jgi:hypothetical protein
MPEPLGANDLPHELKRKYLIESNALQICNKDDICAKELKEIMMQVYTANQRSYEAAVIMNLNRKIS